MKANMLQKLPKSKENFEQNSLKDLDISEPKLDGHVVLNLLSPETK